MEERIIYHGSNVVVNTPKVLTHGHYKDFGYGFYCTDLEKQAKRWALVKKKNHVVNIYTYMSKDELKILKFNGMSEEWRRLLSLANVLHCENPLQIEDDWISDYQLEQGTFDITEVDRELVEEIPYPTQMGKVYQRLIMDTMLPGEDYVEALIRIYNDVICLKIDDYNCSAYYAPSYVLTRAYLNGGF